MTGQIRSYSIHPSKSVNSISTFYLHATTARRKNSEQDEDFIPLIVAPVVIIVCLCWSILYLVKKYKVCRRRQVAQETYEERQTETTNDRVTTDDRVTANNRVTTMDHGSQNENKREMCQVEVKSYHT